MIEIINRRPNFRGDGCQKVTSNRAICSLSKNQFLRISAPFNELISDGKITSDLKELKSATVRSRDKEFARIKKLQREKNGGFILISGLTCMGILIVGTIIFMTIEHLVLK